MYIGFGVKNGAESAKTTARVIVSTLLCLRPLSSVATQFGNIVAWLLASPSYSSARKTHTTKLHCKQFNNKRTYSNSSTWASVRGACNILFRFNLINACTYVRGSTVH